MTLVVSKMIKDWSKQGRLRPEDLNVGGYNPGPGTVARLVVPHSIREWDDAVPAILARAVADADSFFIDCTARPDLMARLSREITEAVEALKASR